VAQLRGIVRTVLDYIGEALAREPPARPNVPSVMPDDIGTVPPLSELKLRFAWYYCDGYDSGCSAILEG